MIPVLDITRQNKILKRELSQVFSDVVQKGVFILGSHVSDFESAFAKYIGSSYAVGVASGTDALTLSLLALGIRPGDEVILPANSYPSVFGITAMGAIPRLVDIDPTTYTIDPDKIASAITGKTKAIIPVHLYGQAADMEAIMAVGKRYKIPIVEDCAQAVGAKIKIRNPTLRLRSGQESEIRNSKVGSLGNIGCFSFYPTKNLGAYGDGGMVVTNDPKIYEKLKLYRMYGEKKRYESVLLGRNSRLDELQAAILFVKLKHLDKWIRKRQEIAKLYGRLFQNQKSKIKNQKYRSKIKNNLQLPSEASYTRHTYHLFVIRTKKRDELKAYLEKKGIGTGIHYPRPIHLQPSFAFLGYKEGDFPESEKASREILSLPMFPELTDREIEQVVTAIKEFHINRNSTTSEHSKFLQV